MHPTTGRTGSDPSASRPFSVIWLLAGLCLVLLAPPLSAHEVRPAYLELTQRKLG